MELKRIKHKNTVTFLRQLSILTHTGISIRQALSFLAENISHLLFQQIILDILNKIEKGSTLSDALKTQPTYFNHVHCAIVHAGEQSGKLDKLLKLLVKHEESQLRFKKKIKKTLRYPLTILLIALFVTIGLLCFVVPQFQSAFSEFGAKLPPFTLLIINLSHIIRHKGLLIVATPIILTIIIIFIKKRQKNFSLSIDGALLKLPVIGKIIKNIHILLWLKVLEILNKAGIPLLNALTIANQLIKNSSLKRELDKLPYAINEGKSLYLSMKELDLLSKQALYLVGIGETSGMLDEMLTRISNLYQETVDDYCDRLNDYIEPFVMMILGILIGSLIIAIYLPIFRMGSAI